MRRALLLSVSILIVLAIAASQLRFQKSGTARVIQRGGSVRALTEGIGFAPGFGGTTCIVPAEDGKLVYASERAAATDAGDVTARVRFRYAPPAKPLASDTGWCSALDALIAEKTAAWLDAADAMQLAADPRAAGHAATEALEAALRAAGVASERLSVRFEVDDDIARTLPKPEVVKNSVPRPPLFLVGLDGADWELLDQLMQQGKMPNLAGLVREGKSGPLRTMHPPLSPLLWNTMLTGVGPLDHKILDFTRFNPATGNKEPITSDERRAPAIWNIATYAGKKVGVVGGLWATYPAEPVRGIVVSDRFISSLRDKVRAPYTTWPRSRDAEWRKIVDAVEQRVDLAALQKFVPSLDASTYATDVKATDAYANPIVSLRRTLVETYAYDEIARQYWRDEKPELLVHYIQGTDVVGHMFAPYYPPLQPGVDPAEFARYSGVPAAYFVEVDRMLGEYAKLVAASNGVLMLASDHGFRWFEGRPTQLSSYAAATAAKWHREDGIYLLWGTGVQPAPRATAPASITQVAPTVAALIGVPAITKSTFTPLHGSSLPPFDYSAAFTPWVPPAAPVPSGASDEEIAKLRALGYIGSAEPVRAATANQEAPTRTGGSYNNAGLLLRNEKKPDEAVAAFEQAIKIDPNLASALWNLSDLLWQNRRDEARSNELLVRGVKNDLPEGEKFLIGRAIGYSRAGDVGASIKLLDGAIAAKPDNAAYRLFRGRYRVELQQCAGALDDFKASQRLNPADVNAYTSAAVAALCMGDRAEAERQMQAALRIDPRAAQGLRGLAGR